MTTAPRRADGDSETTAEGDARRHRVIEVAAELFASKGFDNTTMLDVARAAELKKASLYHYFSSKRSLFLAVLTEGMDELWEGAGAAGSVADPIQRLDALLAAHLRNFQHKLDHVVVFLLERRVLDREAAEQEEARQYLEKRRAYDQLFVDCIRQGQRSGVFRKGDPVVLAYAVLGMVNWMVQWYRPSGRLTMDQIGTILRSCAAAAISPPPGRQSPRRPRR